LWSDDRNVYEESDGTNLEDLALVAVGDIVVLYAHDLLVCEEPPVFLRENLLGPPRPAAGLNVFVPEAFAGQPAWDCVRVRACVEERKKGGRREPGRSKWLHETL
jgi:hypothetical protein